MENIKWIFFDVGSTLVDESKAYNRRIENAISGTEITYNQFYSTMIEFYKNNQKGDLETIKKYNLAKPKWNVKDEFLFPDAKNCLKRLSQKCKIGIIANQSLGTAERLKNFGILEYIDIVIASAEEGISKPDLQIFNLALKRAQCNANMCVMIGDRLDNDIAPANEIGMKTIWIKQGFGKYSTPKTEYEKADFVVNNLTDICKLLLNC